MPDRSDEEIYQKLIDWLRKAWWGLPHSEYLLPTIRSFYNPEDTSDRDPFFGNEFFEKKRMTYG